MPSAFEISTMADAVVETQLKRRPELARKYGAAGRQRCLEDTLFHLKYLYQSAELNDPGLFLDYVDWAKAMLESRGVAASDLLENLETIRAELPAGGDERDARAAAALANAIERLPQLGAEPASFIVEANPMARVAHDYLDLILRGSRREAEALILERVQKGTPVLEVYLGVFEPVQREIGRLWQINRISVAQEHFCTAATQSAMARLYPLMFTGRPATAKMVAACAGDELHEIGLRMVTDVLEMDGWDTMYLGANVPEQSVVAALEERDATMLAVSTTITRNLERLKNLIEMVRTKPSLDHVSIVVGGYPFRVSSDLAKKVQADGYANDAREAIALARSAKPGHADA